MAKVVYKELHHYEQSQYQFETLIPFLMAHCHPKIYHLGKCEGLATWLNGPHCPPTVPLAMSTSTELHPFQDRLYLVVMQAW